jgi:polyisoprenoid-binding protein YceI
MRTGRWWRRVALGVVVVAVLAVGGPYVFFHVVEGKAPAPLTDAQATAPAGTQAAAAGSGGVVDGTWKVGSGSQAGYRVKEVLFGQGNEAVGRTSAVSGQLRIQGNRVSAASFSVDLTTVRSDQSRRDEQFQQRIMDTASFPTASFALTAPIELPSTAAGGVDVRRTASGRLTLHGTTRAVSVDLTARRSGGGIRVSGSIPITFADWNIPNPSFGPVTTQDNGTIELLLVLERV